MDKTGADEAVFRARAEDRSVCPVCGHDFHDAQAVNVCPDRLHRGCGKVSTPDELIGRDDDYEWVH